MFFMANPKDRAFEAAMQLVPNFPPRNNSGFQHRMHQYQNPKEREKSHMIYRGEDHKLMYIKELKKTEKADAAVLSAVYLLTADRKLWSFANGAVKTHHIDFGRIHPSGISPDAYTLLACAKDLYGGSRHITIHDLTDSELVPAKIFRIICNAMTIRRYGMAAVQAANRE